MERLKSKLASTWSRVRKYAAHSLIVFGTLTVSSPGNAVEILFAHVLNTGHVYHADGNEIAGYVNALPGYNVTIRNLSDAVYNDYSNFDQVWVYDLYTAGMGAQTNATQVANYNNIGAWYNSLTATNQNLIADGRIISSAWNNETAWIQGYATEMTARGGGLLLGTDHDAYVSGINNINAAININLFQGTLNPGVAIVDQNSALYNGGVGTFPCGSGDQCIWDNSSPSYAPAGVQPNGQTLTPVAYHGTVNTAFSNAAVSSTIGSTTFGTCGGPNQPPCFVDVPEPASLGVYGIGLAILGIGMAARRRKTR